MDLRLNLCSILFNACRCFILCLELENILRIVASGVYTSRNNLRKVEIKDSGKILQEIKGNTK